MTKEELRKAFEDAIPSMAKDTLWSSDPTNSLGFVKTKYGTFEITVTLVTDPDEWIRDEETEEVTFDLTKE